MVNKVQPLIIEIWKQAERIWLQHRFTLLVWGGFLWLSWTLFWPFLLSPTFSLVDDGYSITKGRLLLTDWSVSNWSNVLIESNLGRFRPVYLLFFTFAYVLFGSHPIGLWFLQSLTVWLTMGLMYTLLRSITKSKWLAVGAPLVWLIMPTVCETIFRLGPTEPRQMVFGLLLLISLWNYRQSGKWWHVVWGGVWWLLATGTKETSLFLLPLFPMVIAEQYIKRGKWWWVVGGSVIFLSLLGVAAVLTKTYLFSGGYVTQNFGLSLSMIKERVFQNRYNFSHYYIILLAGIVSVGLRFLVSCQQKASRWWDDISVASGLLVTIAGSVVFVLAWAFQFERYMYATWLLIVLLAAVEIGEWWSVTTKRRVQKTLFQNGYVVAFLGLFIWVIGFLVLFQGRGLQYGLIVKGNLDVYRRSYDIDQVEDTIIDQLLADTTTTTLYVTNDNYEVIYELGLYVSQFRARAVTVVSPSQDLAKAEAGYLYVPDVMAAYQADPDHEHRLLVGRVLDLKGAEIPKGAELLKATQHHDLIGEEQYWWILKPTGNTK